MRRKGSQARRRRSKWARTRWRRPGTRPEKSRILIVCEGRETEPNYFRGLRDEETVRRRFVLEVRKGKGGSPVNAVEKAVEEIEKAAERKEQFDEVWCVIDVEQTGGNPRLIEARALARRNRIQLALSNPSFECWLLAHFERTARSFADSNQVVEQLNKFWRKTFDQDYQKNDDRIYQRLSPFTETAIKNCRSVREEHFKFSDDLANCNSASEVYRLVERLLGKTE
jgi:hypothetical protein